jgi:signal transduction histidine kinase
MRSPIEYLASFGKSIHTRIMLVSLATGLLSIAVIGAMFRHGIEQPGSENPLIRAVHYFAQHLASEIGYPLNQSKIDDIRQRFDIRVRVEQADGTILFGGELPSIAEMSRHARDKSAFGATHGRYRRLFFMIEPFEGRKYAFVSSGPFMAGVNWPIIFVHLTAFVAVLWGAYALIMRMLAPIQALDHAVQQVAAGNYQTTVDLDRADELGRLAQSFNQMTERICTMLRSRDQLLLDVSHELRSPLARMKLSLEFLPQSAERQSIREEVEELEQITGTILEAARLQNYDLRLELESVDLTEMIQSTVRRYSSTGRNLVFMPPSAVFMVLADKMRSEQVIQNIIDNAIKYSPQDQPIRLEIRQNAEAIEVEIADQGVGIPTQDLPRIFEPFYRVDSSRTRTTGGFGLGLFLCQRIMRAQGGSIRVNSTVGAGTQVLLSFREAKN